MNHQDKINKIITVLDTLLIKCPTTTTQQQQEQQTLADLVNKLKQEEIKELEALGTLGDT
jgi:inorganic pyrophosphatase/exopolyphosphatase